MLKTDQNMRIARVEGEAAMGQTVRAWTWMPFALGSQLSAGDPPFKVRLLGENFVAWRAPDGRIGFVDESCPHRGASLALARNEGCKLRCIFHGWSVDVSGKVIDVPTQAERPEKFAERVKVIHHPVREAAGLAWVWLGGDPVADFPNLPIFGLPDGHVWMTVSKIACNWLQGVEAQLDTAHLGILHSSWTAQAAALSARPNAAKINETKAPTYEVDPAPWGLSAAAIRRTEDGSTFVRVTQYVAPFLSLIPEERTGAGSLFCSVPIDDYNHLFFFGLFDDSNVITDMDPRVQFGITIPIDHHSYMNLHGDRNSNYGQDRGAMDRGHFSGFTESLLQEDLAIQVSMGPIVDRSKENLSSSDFAIHKMRQLLLQAVENHLEGKHPLGSADAYESGAAFPFEVAAESNVAWRSVASTAQSPQARDAA